MAAPNIDPIFSRVADIQWIGSIVAANTTADLTAGTSYNAYVADATNGGFVSSIKFTPIPGGNTTATVARIWMNNGSTTGTAANNVLIGQMTLPAITGTIVAATADYELPINRAFPPGYKIYVTIGTASAVGWNAIVFAGKY